MPAKSKSQQRFFGMVRAAQKGEMKNPSKEVSDVASDISMKDAKKFAKTKHKGLPEKKIAKEEVSMQESFGFKDFRAKVKKMKDKQPEKAMDAGAKARRILKRKEHAKYVSGSTENVPDDIRDHYEVSEGKKKGLWDNIHAKRKRGEKPAKPGDKDYPKTLNVEGLEKARKNVGADKCWDGYKAKGTKKKGGKEVPNCVKEEDKAFNFVVNKLKSKYGDGVLTKGDKMPELSAAQKKKNAEIRAKRAKEDGRDATEKASSGRYSDRYSNRGSD